MADEILFSDKEYLFLNSVAGSYEAMRSSATDPVVLPNENMPVKRRSAFSHQLCDTYENEKNADKIMDYRINNARRDIFKHLKLHMEAQQHISGIESALRENDRRGVTACTALLWTDILGYASLVEQHQAEHKDKAFLMHSTCLPGHWYLIEGYNKMKEKQWNPEQTNEGVNQSIDQAHSYFNAFREGKAPTSELRITDSVDTGEGFNDGTIRAALALNKELLTRAGFKW